MQIKPPVWLFGDKADSCIFAAHETVRKFKDWGTLAEALANFDAHTIEELGR